MITDIAKKITAKLTKCNYIQTEDKELYEYGIFLLMSRIIYAVFTVLVGIILGCFWESIIFYISFSVLRKYAGGFHALSEKRCLLFSTTSIIISLIFITFSEIYSIAVPGLVLAVFATITIFLWAPVDSKEKPLNNNEKKKFRKTALIISTMYLLGVVVTFIVDFNIVFYSISSAIILESILIFLSKLKLC